jgi:3-oxoadipate enol-lactonase
MRLHHQTDGDESSPTLVLGPSLGTDVHLFDAQVAAFAGRFRIVRFDLPGHGGSPDPDGDLTIADLGAAVLELVDGPFHYAGVSMGGAIGQWLGVHSDRVRSLAVLATAARFPNPDQWPERAATVREKGTEAMIPSRTGTWFVEDYVRRDPEGAERLLDMLRATSDEGYAACCLAIGGHDVRADLGSVAVPTLAVAGAEDPATPPSSLREIADGIPGARYEEVPGAAHLLNAEKPAEVNALLAAHWDAAGA